MRAVAYCRVSTNKEEQLDSLAAQQQFFTEFAKRNDYNLVHIYADEGKSGTKMRNRAQLLKLLSDANRGLFDIVLIKDVSRLARNTVDFLTSIRKMKALGITVVFVNYDQTTSDSSEFMLTLLSAMAQEESANTSKRVKFGKRVNMERGRVPNIVYGYDKIPDDYFNLHINAEEAAVVRRIFAAYVNDNKGANKIAMELNREGVKTKRDCNWTQTTVCRVLTNRIYIGKIINGKQEVSDFLTGQRKDKPEEEWMVVERPELAIIDKSVFDRARRLLCERKETFRITGERSSDKHVFSKLIRCTCCGASFRRQVRTYKETYVKWICTGRNANGVDSCANNTVIDEQELLNSIRAYFAALVKDRPKTIDHILAEFKKQYKAKDDNQKSAQELSAALNKLRKEREKNLQLFREDIISMDELRAFHDENGEKLDRLAEELELVKRNISKSDLLHNALTETFKDIDRLVQNDIISNALLSRLIERIKVDEAHNVAIYLKLLTDIGLDESVLLNIYRT
ncbi:MAG: recombinase family protein [Clostridiales bacterium]|jgi:DNA invertase Pin-like site-specific DNA recombinase|nr:recombinase family protein [Clostridiales bacterium]